MAQEKKQRNEDAFPKSYQACTYSVATKALDEFNAKMKELIQYAADNGLPAPRKSALVSFLFKRSADLKPENFFYQKK